MITKIKKWGDSVDFSWALPNCSIYLAFFQKETLIYLQDKPLVLCPHLN